jgi:hypothetical protein
LNKHEREGEHKIEEYQQANQAFFTRLYIKKGGELAKSLHLNSGHDTNTTAFSFPATIGWEEAFLFQLLGYSIETPNKD